MSTITQTNAQVISPCVRNCCLNRADYCLGCKRHIDEIVGWRALSEALGNYDAAYSARYW
ncbi:DUF1289 domain-containing protein [Thalassotalea euphylliae]|uniref:DUF1289 domain-containing protein n=1 Tax=Thalassotalea euphylliae TaxID=1655234 RepID=UPI002163FAFC